MPRSKQIAVLFAAIFFLGLLMRVWGITSGLPYAPGVDEKEAVMAAFYSGGNRLRPLRFEHTAFVPYVLLIEYGSYFLFGKALGLFVTTDDFIVSFFRNPTNFYLVGRLTFALCGALMVLVIGKIGKQFYSTRVGLISAFLLAVDFLSAKEARYVKDDIFSALWVLLSFLFALTFIRTRKSKHYVLAGILCGLAIGAKYFTGLFIPVLIIASIVSEKKLFSKSLFLVIGSIFLGFVFVNPYFVLEPARSISTLAHEFQTNVKFSNPQPIAKPLWWYYLFVHFPDYLGLPLYAVIVGGIVYSLITGFKKQIYLLPVVLPFLFLLTIGFWSNYHLPRYAVMLMPFFFLLAAVFIDHGLKFIFPKRVLPVNVILACLCIALSGVSLIRLVKFAYITTRPDTRLLAKKWIEDNVKTGETIYVEGTLKPEIPSEINAGLVLTADQLKQRQATAEGLGIKSMYMEYFAKSITAAARYVIVASPRRDLMQDVITNEVTQLRDATYYIQAKIPFLVLSSWVFQPESNPDFDDQSFTGEYDVVQSFDPKPAFRYEPHYLDMDFAALDRVRVEDASQLFGPSISIYRHK